MQFAQGLLLSLILGFGSHFLGIWWLVAVAAGLAGFIVPNDGLKSFGAGFLSIGLLSLAQAWWISSSNEGILLDKISQLLDMDASAIYLLTFLISGLLGGFGFLTGAYSREALGGGFSLGGRKKYRGKYR